MQLLEVSGAVRHIYIYIYIYIYVIRQLKVKWTSEILLRRQGGGDMQLITHPTSDKGNNEGNYTSNPAYAIMACLATTFRLRL